MLLIALISLLAACTKKDNLTGTNFSEIEALTFEDLEAAVGGYSFPADSLLSLNLNRKNLLVGNWEGAKAMSILRFINLEPQDSIQAYTEIENLALDLVIQWSSAIERAPLTLNFYKVNSGWAADPDTLMESDYTLIPQATTQITSTINSADTISVALPFELIRNWQADADSTGLNILIKADESNDGFVELKLSTPNSGSRLSFDYKKAWWDDTSEFAQFSVYANLNAYSFSHPEAEVSPDAWKLSNFSPQRIYVDLQPDFTMFKDQYGEELSAQDLKRVTINKAELVLYIKDELPNFQNTFSYSVAALILKERPEENAIIPTVDLYTPEFISNMTSFMNCNDDSLLVNITPIIQAYISEKTFADGTVVQPHGIVILSNYERKDFGEVEFYHPSSAIIEKQPYIKITYTPPFL
ncbi:MAG: hypothetical protein PWP64_224 [Candidatus Cloacimonadota bacterium]|nr:hypothetical protein [Candidatus Cloacimonadota bacterium]